MKTLIMNCIEGNQELKDLFTIKEKEYDDSFDLGKLEIDFIDEVELYLIFHLMNEGLSIEEVDLNDWLFNYLKQ
jgi:hypothetical protein